MPSREAVQEAVGSSNLPWPARLVMLALLWARGHADRHGQPFTPTIDSVARWTGLARSTAAEYVVALDRAGWLDRTVRRWGLQIGQPECWRRETIPDDIRDAVYARDGDACRECGTTEDLTLDHIQPWSRGGPDTVENLRVLCRPCNSSKGARV